MLLTIDAYPNLSKMNNLAGSISESIGKKVDVYWNNEAHNYVITKRGEKGILTEFLERQPISKDKIRRSFWEISQHGGGADHFRKELSLQEVAVNANKAKDAAEKREVREYAAGELYDYEIAGKRSVMVGGGE